MLRSASLPRLPRAWKGLAGRRAAVKAAATLRELPRRWLSLGEKSAALQAGCGRAISLTAASVSPSGKWTRPRMARGRGGPAGGQRRVKGAGPAAGPGAGPGLGRTWRQAAPRPDAARSAGSRRGSRSPRGGAAEQPAPTAGGAAAAGATSEGERSRHGRVPVESEHADQQPRAGRRHLGLRAASGPGLRALQPRCAHAAAAGERARGRGAGVGGGRAGRARGCLVCSKYTLTLGSDAPRLSPGASWTYAPETTLEPSHLETSPLPSLRAPVFRVPTLARPIIPRGGHWRPARGALTDAQSLRTIRAVSRRFCLSLPGQCPQPSRTPSLSEAKSTLSGSAWPSPRTLLF